MLKTEQKAKNGYNEGAHGQKAFHVMINQNGNEISERKIKNAPQNKANHKLLFAL